MENWNPRYNDVYFTPDQGINESRHVFIEGSGLSTRFSRACSRGETQFSIVEIGFGTGLNFMLSLIELQKPGSLQSPDPSALPRLRYVSVEKYPLNLTERMELLSPYFSALPELEQLSSLIPFPRPGWNTWNIPPEIPIPGSRISRAASKVFSPVSSPDVCLELFQGDIREFAEELGALPAGSVHSVYLDGHSPDKNPEMWSTALFRTLNRLCAPEAYLSSYSSAGVVKRALREAGFQVTRRPGFGKKRHMLTARPSAPAAGQPLPGAEPAPTCEVAENTNEKTAGDGAKKSRAPRNKTLSLSPEDRRELKRSLWVVEDCESSSAEGEAGGEWYRDRIFAGDSLQLCRQMPDNSVDLIVADPPYAALRKQFGTRGFSITEPRQYAEWLEPYFAEFARILSDAGSVYVCGDWRGAEAVQPLMNRYFHLRNRITWEREKGRGARANWKNSHEDIWFATKSDSYRFNLDEVKILRSVKAPYTRNGSPRDWLPSSDGAGYRLTHPGNSWTDLTVPFWSMPENTDHPTQKPEKLAARIILASSRPGDLVFDPFLGSGTTAVAARKLGRSFCGCELEEEYCLYALKRLRQADQSPEIQGILSHGDKHIFLHRNSSEAAARKALEQGLLDNE
ncbi:tRNA (5-methylaminomethyl-2-thiouridine)(34)-methyltransferase MnmD [Salinispira pacifica]|uniref:tRNA (5-methylaminomethyl-2-thiouridylate)-methyltransferase n=1 Tax=Salinispira pacifica TaxID=1307761 RepID=V5WF27_9SPIO|nr:tRNA (5-methylaminomethyl-2-thiouridine)(34)-methyltransferase MnmD [Salinispira pacifica]AHC14144.1 tRNA (5-methylaminomethyl-2-thiouridylate)-methyltransferase [Salinispira pacifica]